MKKSIVLGLILTAVFSATVLYAAVKVELEVATVDGEKQLQVQDNDSPCIAGESKSSCIKVNQGSTPNMSFELDDGCNEGSTAANKYKLTNFRISMIKKLWPTAGNPLNAIVAEDFHVFPETGYLEPDPPKYDVKNKKIKLKNANSHAYTVFYAIYAEPCDPESVDDDLVLDPEIRNTGN